MASRPLHLYVDLARQSDGPLVELAVGNGRVTIPVARTTGQRVIGLDRSPVMLEQARDAAAAAGVELDLREGDMRDVILDEPTALTYCPARPLLHLQTGADRRRKFERVAAALRPGGRFAWNAVAFDHRFAANAGGVRRNEPIPHTTHCAVGDNRIDIVMDNGARSSLWWETKNEWLVSRSQMGPGVRLHRPALISSIHGTGRPFRIEVAPTFR